MNSRVTTTYLGSLAVAVALVLGAVSPAPAFDLTGNWVGSWSCSVFADGAKSKTSNKTSTLAATSIGVDRFRAVIDESFDYRGMEIPNAAKPEKGELGIVHCGTDDDLTLQPYSELGRWKVTTKGAKGTLSGITLWSNRNGHIATCKYKYKRVNTNNPNLTYACP